MTLMTMIYCPECRGTGVEEQETFGDEGFYDTTFIDTTFIDCTNCKGQGHITPLEEEKDPVSERKQYLGDGVYLSDDGYQLWLAVNDANHEVVALEPSVFVNLVRLGARRLFQEAAADMLKTIAQGLENTDD